MSSRKERLDERRMIKKCKKCSKEFTTTNASILCSDECRKMWRRSIVLQSVHRWKNKYNATTRLKYNRIKDEVYEHYGGYKCNCCGESNPKFLSLDHINNDGGKHRKLFGITGGMHLYRWIQKNNFPEGFQVLCYNCNLGKARNQGICPHTQEAKEAN
jgi:hypothetical protein